MGSGNTCVIDLKYNEINHTNEIEDIFAVTDRTKSTAATKCNGQSSRGHAVIELAIQWLDKTSGASQTACLHLVDLAGFGKSRNPNCIRCQLSKNQHIPYRNSKLTVILRDSLGAGNSKTMIITALHPAATQIAEKNEVWSLLS
ncbi:kinesin motor domain protein [Cooperia oncophora]